MDCATFWRYLRKWWLVAFRPAWDAFGWLGLVAGAVLWAWNKWGQSSYARFAAIIGFTPETAMSDLIWMIPIAVGAVILAIRLVRAPYEIHVQTLTAIETAKSAQTKAEEDLARYRAQNHGIELICSGIGFWWDSDPELPPGVLISLDVERLVNGNTEDAAIDIKLTVPVYRPGPSFLITMTARPLVSRPKFVESKLPQLSGIVNLPRKQGVGPGFFLFFFSHASLKELPVIPSELSGASLEEFAKLIREAEIQVDMTDVANRVSIPSVLAPGVIEKKLLRLDQERLAAKKAKTAEGSK